MTDGAEPEPPIAELQRIVADLVDSTGATLDRLAEQVSLALPARNATAAPAAFDAFDAICRTTLQSGRGLRGLGFLAAPGEVATVRLWERWWTRTPAGRLVQGEHDLDQHSPTFYDYSERDWFVQVRSSEARSAVFGPYVDFNGTNEYTVTFTRAVRVAARFLGVVAADMHIDQIESQVEPALHGFASAVVLLNDQQRVIASTTPLHPPGSIVRSAADQIALPVPPWVLVEVGH
ncbi:cache domain-containing protein [uncultured Amnibacterium sp.]|uniref:cache domain-containing protein n=1 Tax=uncultured Amnibacterium sp. TaxID=1631851 RepID=UPI0035C99A17